MKETSQTRRSILATLAVVVGLFMIAVAPFVIQTSLEQVLTELQIVSAQKPDYASGTLLFSYAFPLYRGLIFIGGVTLILLALPIHRGEEWTFPIALLASAFPSAGGMFMFMPYVSFVDGFPPGDYLTRRAVHLLVADRAPQRGQVVEVGTIPCIDLCRDADDSCFHCWHREFAHVVNPARKASLQWIGHLGSFLIPANSMDLRRSPFHCNLSDCRPQAIRLVADIDLGHIPRGN